MKYLHEPLSKAAKACVEDLRRDGGMGGVIALDNRGNGECYLHRYTASWLLLTPDFSSNASELFGNV